MDLTELVRSYVKQRNDFVARIGLIAQQLNAWTDEHSRVSPSLFDVAHFEGLRAERSQLLSEFTEAEDAFVVQMLQTMGAAARDKAG